MPEKRILLVEDEATTRDPLENVLLAQGYRVDVAASVGEAMTFLRARSYTLVLTDWRLPDGDGLLIADRLPSQGLRRS
jgi:two-component system response regulator PilR (NtrC family)